MKKIKKIGMFNSWGEEICTLKCKCGWHISIGGYTKKQLNNLKKFLRQYADNYYFHKNAAKKDK